MRHRAATLVASAFVTILACGSTDGDAAPSPCAADASAPPAQDAAVEPSLQDAARDPDAMTLPTGPDAIVRSSIFGAGCDHTAGALGRFAPFEPVADGSMSGGSRAHVACTTHLTSETVEARGSAWLEGGGGIDVVHVQDSVTVTQRGPDGEVVSERVDCQRLATYETGYAPGLFRFTVLCPEAPASDAGPGRCGFLAEVQFRGCGPIEQPAR